MEGFHFGKREKVTNQGKIGTSPSSPSLFRFLSPPSLLRQNSSPSGQPRGRCSPWHDPLLLLSLFILLWPKEVGLMMNSGDEQ
ncbi:hypothetical protein RchiOBHm_Chr3g0496821 [Rosa chinensis]|uniref:Uncharacterized protein n=1 Tax=Rosa chinensis TaxID=74649 RepID=A0A2P6RHK7_ROSCH|nr:hypothetical protein RchiOBHm_Chr3g0496821 [Rosa chinensis]